MVSYFNSNFQDALKLPWHKLKSNEWFQTVPLLALIVKHTVHMMDVSSSRDITHTAIIIVPWGKFRLMAIVLA